MNNSFHIVTPRVKGQEQSLAIVRSPIGTN
jgi:hypothetical protein